jgi:transcriptional regulator with XRE-family HTH domain
LAEEKGNIEISKRLRTVVNNSGMTDQDFAQSVNIDRSQFGRILNAKLNITLRQIMEISNQYQVRIGWLLQGEEPMQIKEKSGTSAVPDHLLTQFKNSLADIQSNWLLIEPYLKPDLREEIGGPDVEYSGKLSDKNQRAGKR